MMDPKYIISFLLFFFLVLLAVNLQNLSLFFFLSVAALQPTALYIYPTCIIYDHQSLNGLDARLGDSHNIAFCFLTAFWFFLSSSPYHVASYHSTCRQFIYILLPCRFYFCVQSFGSLNCFHSCVLPTTSFPPSPFLLSLAPWGFPRFPVAIRCSDSRKLGEALRGQGGVPQPGRSLATHWIGGSGSPFAFALCSAGSSMHVMNDKARGNSSRSLTLTPLPTHVPHPTRRCRRLCLFFSNFCSRHKLGPLYFLLLPYPPRMFCVSCQTHPPTLRCCVNHFDRPLSLSTPFFLRRFTRPLVLVTFSPRSRFVARL
jgi:hypothetical protein